MNIRVLAATAAGGIVWFFGGWLIFGIILMSYFKENTVQYAGLLKEPMPEMIALIVSCLAWAWLTAFVFDRWAGIKDFVGGLKGGALIIAPIALAIDMQFLAFMNLYTGIAPVFVNLVANTILGALAGGVTALVLGRFAGTAETE